MAQAAKSMEALLQLGAAMRQAIKVKDRRYLFRSYRRCFVGQDAVAWMVASGAAADATEAVQLGNSMMEMGLFHHVVYEHLFEDDYLFYRFSDGDPSGEKDRVQLGQPSSAAPAADMSGGSTADSGGGGPPLRLTASADGALISVPDVGQDAATSDGGLPQTRREQEPPPSSAVDDTPATAAPAAPPPAPTPAPRGFSSPQTAATRPLATVTLGERLLLSEPRQEKGRQVLAGQLQQLQGRVAHMQQTAEAQRSITEILVSEVSTLKGEVADLRVRLNNAAAQLQASGAEAAVACQQVTVLRLLTLGLAACMLQQTLNAWIGSSGLYDRDAVGALFGRIMPVWSVALAAMMMVLALKLLLQPIRHSTVMSHPASSPAHEGAYLAHRGSAIPGADAQAVGKAHSDKADCRAAAAAVVHVSAVAGDGLFAVEGNASGGSGTTLRVRWEGLAVNGNHTTPDGGVVTLPSSFTSAGAKTDGDASAERSLGGKTTLSRSSTNITVRRYAEVVRALTAPLRLHLPGRRLGRDSMQTQLQGLSQLGQAPVARRLSAPEVSKPSQRRQSGTATVESVCVTESESPAKPTSAAARLSVTRDSGGGELSGASDTADGGPVAAADNAPPWDGPAKLEAAATTGNGMARAAAPTGATVAGGAVIGVVVPRRSDFEGWPDAPILLAFNTGLVPEHALAAAQHSYSIGSTGGDGARRAAAETAGAQEGRHLVQASSAPELSIREAATEVATTTTTETDAASGIPPEPRAVSSTSVYGDCCDISPDGDGPAEPMRPATQSAGFDAGAPRPLPLPTPGLVRLAANGVRAIRVETELFSGELVVWIRGLATAPEALFAAKKRMTWVAMQGRFKQPLSVDEVVTGQEFARSFKNLPATWFVEKVLLSMARQISPSMRVGALSAPYLLMPILAAAQLVNVSKPGCQPPMMECNEDVRLFCPRLSSGAGGQPASADARRRHFSVPKNRAGLVYDTENVWTFHFWQQFVDVATYRLDFGYTYDLVRHLDGQPMQIMAKDVKSGKYLYNVLMWHERLAAEASAAAGGGDNSVGGQDAPGTGMDW